MNKCKISVLIITYNQNDVIGRAIDSIIQQKDWGLFEIVICDDCSTDNNWGIISNYVNKYAGLIRAYRNTRNLGIYGNVEKLVSLRGDGDLFCLIAGDDALCNGWFKAIQLFIEERRIDVNNRAITFYSDWKNISIDGREQVMSNKLIAKGYDAFRLKHRSLICNRSTISTKRVYNNFAPIPLNNGISYSEGVFDRQIQLLSDNNYYIPFVGSIYYSGIGISTKMNTNTYIKEEIFKWNKYMEIYTLCDKDIKYCLYKIHYFTYRISPTIKEALLLLFYYLRSVEPKFGINIQEFASLFKYIFSQLFKH